MSMCIIVSILCDSAIEKVDDNKEYRKKNIKGRRNIAKLWKKRS